MRSVRRRRIWGSSAAARPVPLPPWRGRAPLLNTATVNTGLPGRPRGNVAPSDGAARSGYAGSTCLGDNLVEKTSNIIGSVVDSSDASSSPRSEPLWQVFLPGERGVRTARQRPIPTADRAVRIPCNRSSSRNRSAILRSAARKRAISARRLATFPATAWISRESPLTSTCPGCARRRVTAHMKRARYLADRRENQPNRRDRRLFDTTNSKDGVIAPPGRPRRTARRIPPRRGTGTTHLLKDLATADTVCLAAVSRHPAGSG